MTAMAPGCNPTYSSEATEEGGRNYRTAFFWMDSGSGFSSTLITSQFNVATMLSYVPSVVSSRYNLNQNKTPTIDQIVLISSKVKLQSTKLVYH